MLFLLHFNSERKQKKKSLRVSESALFMAKCAYFQKQRNMKIIDRVEMESGKMSSQEDRAAHSKVDLMKEKKRKDRNLQREREKRRRSRRSESLWNRGAKMKSDAHAQ